MELTDLSVNPYILYQVLLRTEKFNNLKQTSVRKQPVQKE